MWVCISHQYVCCINLCIYLTSVCMLYMCGYVSHIIVYVVYPWVSISHHCACRISVGINLTSMCISFMYGYLSCINVYVIYKRIYLTSSCISTMCTYPCYKDTICYLVTFNTNVSLFSVWQEHLNMELLLVQSSLSAVWTLILTNSPIYLPDQTWNSSRSTTGSIPSNPSLLLEKLWTTGLVVVVVVVVVVHSTQSCWPTLQCS